MMAVVVAVAVQSRRLRLVYVSNEGNNGLLKGTLKFMLIIKMNTFRLLFCQSELYGGRGIVSDFYKLHPSKQPARAR